MRIESALVVSQVSGLLPVALISHFGDGRSQYGVVLLVLGFPVLSVITAALFAATHRYVVPIRVLVQSSMLWLAVFLVCSLERA